MCLEGKSMRTVNHQIPEGTILRETYRILYPLEVKDLWTVYLAESVEEESEPQRAALKVTDAGSLRPEARRLASVPRGMSSSFPAFYREFQEGPLSCIAMEYIPGISLDEDLFGYADVPGKGRLRKEEVVAIGVQLASAAVALHTRRPSLIFCGFRPANILLDERQPGLVRLPDLSVARPPTQAGREQSPALAIRGQEGYMPPEYDGVVTPRTDIYGLGATLWVLLTGEESWQERGILGNWSLSPLVRLLRAMVDENPKRRPATMTEVSERLSRMGGLPESKSAPKPGTTKSTLIPARASSVQPKPTSTLPLSRARPVKRRSGTWK